MKCDGLRRFQLVPYGLNQPGTLGINLIHFCVIHPAWPSSSELSPSAPRRVLGNAQELDVSRCVAGFAAK